MQFPDLTTSSGALLMAAVLGTIVAAGYTVPDEQKFIDWANDYISFVTNTGVSVCYINIGDWIRYDSYGDFDGEVMRLVVKS